MAGHLLPSKAIAVSQDSDFLRIPVEIRAMIFKDVLRREYQIHIENKILFKQNLQSDEPQPIYHTKLHMVCRQIYAEVYHEKLFLRENAFTFHTAEDLKRFISLLTKQQRCALKPVTIHWEDCLRNAWYAKSPTHRSGKPPRVPSSFRGPNFAFLSTLHHGLRHLKVDISSSIRPLQQFTYRKGFRRFLYDVRNVETFELRYEDYPKSPKLSRMQELFYKCRVQTSNPERCEITLPEFEQYLLRVLMDKASITVRPRKNSIQHFLLKDFEFDSDLPQPVSNIITGRDTTLWDMEMHIHEVIKTTRFTPQQLVCGITVLLLFSFAIFVYCSPARNIATWIRVVSE